MGAADAPLANTLLSEKASSIEYRIEGPLQSVFNAIAGLMRDFHPVGYGTRVRSIDNIYPQDDKYVAIVTRSRSCE